MLETHTPRPIELEIKKSHEVVELAYHFGDEPVLVLQDQVKRGAYYTFQVVMRSNEIDIDQIHVEKTDLCTEGAVINKEQVVCFNQDQVTYQGESVTQPIDVIKGELKVLWFGIIIPETQAVGTYSGKIAIKKEEQVLGVVEVKLEVLEAQSVQHELHALDKQSRLFWLNGTKGVDQHVTQGYQPIQFQEQTLRILGREVQLDAAGLPQQILSYYDEQVALVADQTPLLSQPITLDLEMQSGERLVFDKPFVMDTISDSHAQWHNHYEDDNVVMMLTGELQYDGWMRYSVHLKAKKAIDFKETKLVMTYPKTIAKYMMGLGVEGGELPEAYAWQWDEKKHQDAVWIGTVNGGIKCQLKDDTYTAPLVNVYFNQRFLKPPKAWDNAGKGGISLVQGEEEVSLCAYTNGYRLEAEEERNFGFECLITPLKPIDYATHWQTRYYHPHENRKVDGDWVSNTQQEGCNYMIVHHGQELHPFINYPFVEEEDLKALTHAAHQENLGVKLYYTIREISNHAAEFWPWYHLGLFPKASQTERVFWEGQKKLWVQDVFGRDVIPAWEHVFETGKHKGKTCSAVIVAPYSQIDNYYIEGLDWLVNEVGINGIYIDDTSIGRETLRRARKVLDQKEKSLIDMHSWNHFNTHAGYAHSTLIYMDLFPYIDSLWFGEGFDYNQPPDYWLVALAGIPYGLMGQMLEGDGNPYRGMLYGMTNRTGWGSRSAQPLYQLWDMFGIQDAKMYGYWNAACPIKTDSETVLATAYVKADKTLIALASWAEAEEEVTLQVDWSQLGYDTEQVCIVLPAIEGIQEYAEMKDLNRIKVQPQQGALILLEKGRAL